jgi:hypothetical protein
LRNNKNFQDRGACCMKNYNFQDSDVGFVKFYNNNNKNACFVSNRETCCVKFWGACFVKSHE